MKTICEIEVDDLGLKWNLFLAKSGDSNFKEQSIYTPLSLCLTIFLKFQIEIITNEKKTNKLSQKLILM